MKILAYNGKTEVEGIWKEDEHYVNESPYWEKYKKFCTDGIYALKDPYVRVDEDPYLMSVMITPVMKRGIHKLKEHVKNFTGLYYLELDEIFKGPIRFNALPKRLIKLYACPDTPNTIKVRKALAKLLPSDESMIYDLDCRLLKVKATNEFYGMRIKKDKLIPLIENEEYKVNKLADIFKKNHKVNGNINSPQVLRDIMYNKLRCPVEVRTKTNQPSTSKVAIDRMVELGTIKNYDKTRVPAGIVDLNNEIIVKGEDLVSNRYPSLVILKQYNLCRKELGALKRIQRKSHKNRVIFGINSVGAASGRQTSDAHQYSDVMKSLVLSDSPYHVFWSSDYKQIELRVLAYLAGQTDLIKLCDNPDVDIHRAILSIIKGLEIWEISEEMRKKGKAVNFGVVYGMSEWGLAKRNVGPKPDKEDVLDALKSINDFYNGLPYIKKFVADNEEYVKSHGYIKTAFGWYRYFKSILDPSASIKQIRSWVRAANNTPVQGFAATLMKMGEVNVQERIEERGWDKRVDCDGVWLPKVRLMLSIHDEMLLSSHESIPVAEIIEMFRDAMEIKIDGAPNFYASPAMVGNWLDGKNPAYEIPITLRNKVIEEWHKGNEIINTSNWADVIRNYNTEKLENYMKGLIAKYKTVDAVANHVRDDELTHTLISVYIDPKVHPEDKALTHIERIRVATERYMSGVEIDINNTNVVLFKDKVEDDEIKINSFEDLEKYVAFDDNGEVIVDEFEEEEEEDDLDNIIDYHRAYIEKSDRTYAIYMMDEVWIDLMDWGITELTEKINQGIAKLSAKGKPYRVVYMIDSKRKLHSELYVDYIPKEIDKLIKAAIEEDYYKDAISI